MKKYTSRSEKRLAIVASIFGAVLFAGLIFLFTPSSNVWASIALIALGGYLGLLFFSCFLAEKGRALMLDVDSIVFPRGADINGKMVFQKTVVKSSDIRSVKSILHKGDKIISGDCFFHTIELKDGTKITVTLYSYGKEAEKEILDFIKNSIT